MEKTLTISIAAYNVENYIKQTLDSLIDENVIDDMEIFVVDDGGSDKTLEIAQEYAKRYPRSIFPIHKQNGGYGSTINTSIELASGKYFKQLDGDDWYQTENLKYMIDLMKKVSVDCFLTDFMVYRETFNKYVYKNPYDYMEDGEYKLDQSGIDSRLSMYTSAFRTELLQKMPNRLTEHCFYTDIEYSALPIPYINTIYVFHKAIYIYRTGEEGQSVSVTGIEKHYQEHDFVFWRLVGIYRDTLEGNEINVKLFRYLLGNRLKEHYQFLCILPDSAIAKQEIVKLNKRAQNECPEILEYVLEKWKRYKMLVYCPILGFPIYSYKIKKNWKEAGRLH